MYAIVPMIMPGLVSTAAAMVTIASVGACGRACERRDAEVEHLDVAVGPQHQVVGLDVAMHDRRGVGRGQRRRGLDADVEDLAKRQRSALETLTNGFALDEFRDEESCGVVIADLVDRQDVGMIERRCGTSFVKKTAEAFRIATELTAQDFERHQPSERGIQRLVNLAHAAAAQQALNLIAADGGPCTQRHRRLRLYRRDRRRQSSG